MARVYSTYEAKAKLSEILKKARAGQRVGISYRGELVAEVAPIQPVRETFEKRLKRLEAQGVIVPAKHPGKPFPRIVCRPGALKRFLASRDSPPLTSTARFSWPSPLASGRPRV